MKNKSLSTRSRILNQRGVISFFISFIIVAVVLVMIFAVAVPTMITMNTAMYKAGEDILIDNNAMIQSIADANIRAAMTSANNTSIAGAQTNIDVLQTLFQYSWAIILLLVGVIFYLLTRTNVERQSYG